MSVYNAGSERTLREAIESIRSQSMSDIEFIICDDGSTNGTDAMLRRLTREDIRIRLVRNESNRKAAFARNRCIAACTAEYVAVMDADDISQRFRLERQADFLDRHAQFAFVGTTAELFDERGVWGRRAFPVHPEKEHFLFTMPYVHASIMFRREALLAVGGYRDAADTVRVEDYDLLLRLYAAGCRGANLPDELYSVREDEALYRRRLYRHKVHEARVRYRGFKALGLLPLGWLYVLKPLVVGMIPHGILMKLKDRYYGRMPRRSGDEHDA